MARYAATTRVSVDRSLEEIRGLFERFGASEWAYAQDETGAVLGFRLHGRLYRIRVPLPGAIEAMSIQRKLATRLHINRPTDQKAAHKQEVARRWRSLALYTKALMVAVDDGILPAETLLMPFAVLPNGGTVEEWLEPQVGTAYETGTMPALMPGLGPRALPDGR